jgi:hypothetical protein
MPVSISAVDHDPDDMKYETDVEQGRSAEFYSEF